MERKSGSLIEWLSPLVFIAATGWLIWHSPAFILDLFPPADESLIDQLSAQFIRNDVTPGLSGVFGGFADIVDWSALLIVPLVLVIGTVTVRRAPMEFEHWRIIDRVSVFVGRVTMMLVAILLCVMLYEVLLRYVFEAPTLWANELSLWMAGFVFLTSGLYAMQQRCHIRIFLLYDMVPRWMQRLFDCISAFGIALFAAALIYGSYKQVFLNKFMKFETFGTAFDPPIPATIQPAILILIALIAVQAVINVFSDWNLEPEIHTAADDIDQDELEAIKRSVGAE